MARFELAHNFFSQQKRLDKYIIFIETETETDITPRAMVEEFSYLMMWWAWWSLCWGTSVCRRLVPPASRRLGRTGPLSSVLRIRFIFIRIRGSVCMNNGVRSVSKWNGSEWGSDQNAIFFYPFFLSKINISKNDSIGYFMCVKQKYIYIFFK